MIDVRKLPDAWDTFYRLLGKEGLEGEGLMIFITGCPLLYSTIGSVRTFRKQNLPRSSV